MRDVVATIRSELPDADILQIAYQGGLSNNEPTAVAAGIVEEIDAAIGLRDNEYREITLIGFSYGALLARKVYLIARGFCRDLDPLGNRTPLPWHTRVKRVILLAGFTRGWTGYIERPENCPRVLHVLLLLGLALSRLLHFGGFLRAAVAGSPFVANIRADWLRLPRVGELAPPLTVQLLGDQDGMVSAKDHIDLESGQNFVYLHLPSGTNHCNAASFQGAKGKRRRERFAQALITSRNDLQSEYPMAEDQRPDPAVGHVVFVMHGIRDEGRWQQPLADCIRARGGTSVRTVIASYGYMPMLPFLLWSERRRNVRWFMDRYIETMARYPNAKISYIGHSNGTYLLAAALETYSSCSVHRVVFAGSVVRTTYPWDEFVRSGRVGTILNYVASADWVVAVFPAIFERYGGELGAAGHYGFTDHAARESQVQFVRGQHAAALTTENFESMASFILNGRPEDIHSLLAARQSQLVMWSYRFCELWWLVLLAVIGSGLLAVVTCIPMGWTGLDVITAKVLAACAYLMVVVFLAYRA